MQWLVWAGFDRKSQTFLEFRPKKKVPTKKCNNDCLQCWWASDRGGLLPKIHLHPGNTWLLIYRLAQQLSKWDFCRVKTLVKICFVLALLIRKYWPRTDQFLINEPSISKAWFISLECHQIPFDMKQEFMRTCSSCDPLMQNPSNNWCLCVENTLCVDISCVENTLQILANAKFT